MQSFLFQEIAERICNDFAHHKVLPAERTLAEKYICARSTIRSAIQYLRDSNLISTSSPKGHVLNHATIRQQLERRRNTGINIVLFTVGKGLQDPHQCDMLAGAIHQASVENVNLVIRQITETNLIDKVASLSYLHPGIKADGYIITGEQSVKLHKFLESSMVPCVALGWYREYAALKRSRFVDFRLNDREVLTAALQKFWDFGHEKIMIACNSTMLGKLVEEIFQDHHRPFSDDLLITFTTTTHAGSINHSNINTIVRQAGHYTGLLVTFGYINALAIYHELRKAGIRIPEDLSVMMFGGSFDFYARILDLARIDTNANAEGEACVREVVEQIRLGELRYGSYFSPYAFIDGSSMKDISPAKQNQPLCTNP
ncbi:substrate-binding domain-containing protein [Victivallis sp. Marseille-Q1083]|uniref:substrate-binding domain-containing protein n=1 Tax=Victivallis sp. Marseille-Q1083 TaxID=2717288 RepID=UPI00158DC246|nr:substrate-binding domain-containing protein [Victivallis sp. Marseille-Q1083]